MTSRNRLFASIAAAITLTASHASAQRATPAAGPRGGQLVASDASMTAQYSTKPVAMSIQQTQSLNARGDGGSVTSISTGSGSGSWRAFGYRNGWYGSNWGPRRTFRPTGVNPAPYAGFAEEFRAVPPGMEAQAQASAGLDRGSYWIYATEDAEAFVETLAGGDQRAAQIIAGSQTGENRNLVIVPKFSQYSTDPRRTGGYTYYGTYPYWGYGSYWWWGAYHPWISPGSYGKNYSGLHWWYFDMYRGPIDGPTGFSLKTEAAEGTDTAPPPVQLTALEEADAAMSQGLPAEAAELYRKHMADDPDDAWALRSMGFALIESGSLDDGIAVVRLAYARDPGLSRYPVPFSIFGDDTTRLRKLLTDTVRRAHQLDTASGWLAVTALMQAEGRFDPALKMLARSEERGLESEIVSALRSELGG